MTLAAERDAVLAVVADLAPSLVPGPGADPSLAAERALQVAYRLLFAAEARRRGALVTDADACAGLQVRPSRQDLDTASPRLTDVRVGPEPASRLGALHQALLCRRPRWAAGRLTFDRDDGRRRSQGSWFTPEPLVDNLLEATLTPAGHEVVDRPVTVCDPACGSGVFLVAAARRLATQTGRPMREVVSRSIHGVDRDPLAVEAARVALWLELAVPGERARMPALALRVGDALLGTDAAHVGVPLADLDAEQADLWCARHGAPESGLLHWELAFPRVFGSGGFDVVVGNPPFLSQLQSRTASTRGTAALLQAMADGALRPYTDTSAVFLHRATRWVRPGGRVGLLQPQSLLAARDAAAVRADVASRCALESLWASPVPAFEASVLTCAPVLRREALQGPVRRTHGPGFAALPSRPVSGRDLAGEWSFLLADGLGVPEVVLSRAPGTVGDLAACTADFRDQYYGLRGHVHEAQDLPSGAPLVTAGLIDPALCAWGSRPARVLKQAWDAPVVDVAALDDRLLRWARQRLVPKVLLAPQGPVLEAAADPEGRWLPSVPVVTVATDPENVWRLLAVLLAPPVSAHAATRYAGTGLTMRSLKLSARQVAALPLPGDRALWDEAARLVERAQRDHAGRARRLVAAGRLMVRAYAADEQVLTWWEGRLRRERLTPAGQ